jgi:hypothetical protein
MSLMFLAHFQFVPLQIPESEKLVATGVALDGADTHPGSYTQRAE